MVAVRTLPVPKFVSVLEEGMSGKNFSISANVDSSLKPENAMDNDRKTYVHSANVEDENFEPFPTLNITFG